MSISLSPHLLSRSQELLFCRKGRRKGTQDMLSLRFRTSRRPCGRLVPTFILSGGLIFYCKTTLTSYKPINQVTRHSLLFMQIEFLPQDSGPPPLQCNMKYRKEFEQLFGCFSRCHYVIKLVVFVVLSIAISFCC